MIKVSGFYPEGLNIIPKEVLFVLLQECKTATNDQQPETRSFFAK